MHGPAYRERRAPPRAHLRVMHAIEGGRTAALGGHVEGGDHCGHRRPVSNSCRNRHGPKCQALAKAAWWADRRAELLPVGYFHTVFPLPPERNDLLAANQPVLYALLSHTVAETPQAFARDPAHRPEGQLGFTAVLHTCDQKLVYHVPLRCVIAGGARASDGRAWRPARPNYLFPVKALSRAFRGKYRAGLRRAFARGDPVFPGRRAEGATAAKFPRWLSRCQRKDGVAYSQPPFAGPDKVLEYLSRYTHRVAISSPRRRTIAAGRVTFDHRARRDGDARKQLALPAHEFIRRFLRHGVPPGFCRIRHYGFLGNRAKPERLARCRALLGQAPPAGAAVPGPAVALPLRFTGLDVTRCPRCRQGTRVVVERLPGPPRPARPACANTRVRAGRSRRARASGPRDRAHTRGVQPRAPRRRKA